MADLSMLEQIAQRFETYASDQDAMFARRYTSAAEAKRCQARALGWRAAAKELREIGHDNYGTFLREVQELVYGGPEPVVRDTEIAITALFITPPDKDA